MKKNRIRKKVIIFGVPAVILAFVIVCSVTFLATKKSNEQTSEKQFALHVEKLENEVAKEISSIVGIISADIQLNAIDEILRAEKVFDQGYAYAIDKVSGLVFGNHVDEEMNGQEIGSLTSAQAKTIAIFPSIWKRQLPMWKRV